MQIEILAGETKPKIMRTEILTELKKLNVQEAQLLKMCDLLVKHKENIGKICTFELSSGFYEEEQMVRLKTIQELALLPTLINGRDLQKIKESSSGLFSDKTAENIFLDSCAVLDKCTLDIYKLKIGIAQ